MIVPQVMRANVAFLNKYAQNQLEFTWKNVSK